MIAATKALRLFEHGLLGRAGVYKEDPLGLLDLDSEPEPDIVITDSEDVETYGTHASRPRLVIEMARIHRRNVISR